MITALQDAATNSQDIIEHPPLIPIQEISTGHRGRPRKEIDRDILETSLHLCGVTDIAPVFGCSSRTVRRRALEHGLVDPCPPVYITYEDPDTGEHV